MLAFWVALAISCAGIASGIIACVPWVVALRRPAYMTIAAGSFFGAVLGRQVAYSLRSDLFASGADLFNLQNLTFGICVAIIVVSIIGWLVSLL
jgi:hypothetical protein